MRLRLAVLVVLFCAGCTPAGYTFPVPVLQSYTSFAKTVLATLPPEKPLIVSSPTINSSLEVFLPKSSLTPGAVDPRVVQGNIHQTICKYGYTKTVRPPEVVSEPMKRQSILDYGLADRKLGDYEYDHLIPLELGGASVVQNLWPERLSGKWGAPVKDELEDKLNQLVCDGQLNLVIAQQAISGNWIAAYIKYVGYQ